MECVCAHLVYRWIRHLQSHGINTTMSCIFANHNHMNIMLRHIYKRLFPLTAHHYDLFIRMGMLTCVTEELSEKCVIIMTVIGYKYIESLKYHCYDLGSVELNMGF